MKTPIEVHDFEADFIDDAQNEASNDVAEVSDSSSIDDILCKPASSVSKSVNTINFGSSKSEVQQRKLLAVEPVPRKAVDTTKTKDSLRGAGSKKKEKKHQEAQESEAIEIIELSEDEEVDLQKQPIQPRYKNDTAGTQALYNILQLQRQFRENPQSFKVGPQGFSTEVWTVEELRARGVMASPVQKSEVKVSATVYSSKISVKRKRKAVTTPEKPSLRDSGLKGKPKAKSKAKRLVIAETPPVRPQRITQSQKNAIIKQKLCNWKEDQALGFEEKLIEFKDGSTGRGILAKKEFKNGEFLMEYRGRVIHDKALFARLEAKYKRQHLLSYTFHIEATRPFYYIDATAENSDYGYGRLVNHSIQNPNCKVCLLDELLLHLLILLFRLFCLNPKVNVVP